MKKTRVDLTLYWLFTRDPPNLPHSNLPHVQLFIRQFFYCRAILLRIQMLLDLLFFLHQAIINFFVLLLRIRELNKLAVLMDLQNDKKHMCGDEYGDERCFLHGTYFTDVRKNIATEERTGVTLEFS